MDANLQLISKEIPSTRCWSNYDYGIALMSPAEYSWKKFFYENILLGIICPARKDCIPYLPIRKSCDDLLSKLSPTIFNWGHRVKI
ncbi:MAG TPA: hypothetical protein VJU13_12020 [Candidatus Nitrosocosmicus sp.]|nr:hypothetical protein [Candidatus Nitrosocosmicus sp.]